MKNRIIHAMVFFAILLMIANTVVAIDNNDVKYKTTETKELLGINPLTFEPNFIMIGDMVYNADPKIKVDKQEPKSDEKGASTPTGGCEYPQITYYDEFGSRPVECINGQTESRCSQMYGQWTEGATCAELNTPKFGACEYESDGEIKCYNWLREARCEEMGKISWTADVRCVEPVCGNGIVERNEECDDGNTNPFDSCTNLCELAPPKGACENPRISYRDENGPRPIECLSGKTELMCEGMYGQWSEGMTCAELNTPKYGACEHVEDGETVCTNWLREARCDELGKVSWTPDERCVDPECGNGVVERNEECDDGNENPFDSCTNSCELAPPKGACEYPRVSFQDENGPRPIECLSGKTELMCDGMYGQWTANTTCTALNTPKFGACEYERDGEIVCTNWLLEARCEERDGVSWTPDERCIEPVCGNGIVERNEECDDGNDNPFDSCTNSCELTPPKGACEYPRVSIQDENGYRPIECLSGRTELMCNGMYGDWTANTTCAELNTPKFGACNYVRDGETRCVNWLLEATCDERDGEWLVEERCYEPSCGNGILDPAEECDDGNDVDNDGCSSSCELPPPLGACENPRITRHDDDGPRPVECINSQTEYRCGLMYGQWTSETTCAELNTPKFGACEYERDGEVRCYNWLRESRCEEMGMVSWTADVRCQTPVCGNGILERNEECDDGNDVNTDSCTNSCTNPVPRGACEHPGSAYQTADGVNIACIDSVSSAMCRRLEGTWNEGDECSELDTPKYGACKYMKKDEAMCENNMFEEACDKLGGSWQAEIVCPSYEVETQAETIGSCLVDEKEGGCLEGVAKKKCAALDGKFFLEKECKEKETEEDMEESDEEYLKFCKSVIDKIGDAKIEVPKFVPISDEVVQVFDKESEPIMTLTIKDKVLTDIDCESDEDYTYKASFDLESLEELRDSDDPVGTLKKLLDEKKGDLQGKGFLRSINTFLAKTALKISGFFTKNK